MIRTTSEYPVKEGVERIPAGVHVDPDYHEAALRVVSDEEEGTVVEEVRAGYMLKRKGHPSEQ